MDGEEKKVFRKLYSKLRKSLEPGSVAAELYSKQILTDEQYHKLPSLSTDGEKNDHILKCVQACGKPGIFDIFVQCIKDADPAMEYLAEELIAGLASATHPNPESTHEEEITHLPTHPLVECSEGTDELVANFPGLSLCPTEQDVHLDEVVSSPLSEHSPQNSQTSAHSKTYEDMKLKEKIVTTLLSEKLISEATAMEAYGTPITEDWMRNLFLTVLKSRASYTGDRELWLDVIGRVGEVYEQHIGVSDFVTILKVTVACKLPFLLINDFTLQRLCSMVLSSLKGPEHTEQILKVADFLEKCKALDHANNLRLLCELRDVGILSDDKAYSLSCYDIDYNLESKFTRSLLRHMKVNVGREVFEKVVHLSSKHGAHGLSRISQVICCLLEEFGPVKELKEFLQCVPYVPSLTVLLISVFKDGEKIVRVAEICMDAGLELLQGDKALKGIIMLKKKGLLSKEETTVILGEWSSSPDNTMPLSACRALMSKSPQEINMSVLVLTEYLEMDRELMCLAAVGELKAATLLSKEDISGEIPFWSDEVCVEKRIIQTLSKRVPFLPEVQKILEKNKLVTYNHQLKIIIELSDVLTLGERIQLLAEVVPSRTLTKWVSLLRHMQSDKSDVEKRVIHEVLKRTASDPSCVHAT